MFDVVSSTPKNLYSNPHTLKENSRSVCRHVAIIMDGNRRWAAGRNLPKAAGHREGVNALRRIVEHAGRTGLEALTVYAFSTENWQRPSDEVQMLMALFVQIIAQEVEHLQKHHVRLRFIGNLSAFDPPLYEKIQVAMKKTAENKGLQLQVALNYGSRHELVHAVQTLAQAVQNGTLDPLAIDETHIRQALYTADLPDPDLLIRTGGEHRLSNYLLWQCAYTELYMTDTLWPDFTPDTFDQALETYIRRDRRFGQ